MTTSSNTDQAGLRVDLGILLDLPLEPQALAVVWREILDRHSWDRSSEEQQVRAQLLQSLHALELSRAAALCEEGRWTEGLNQLEGSFRHTALHTAIADALLRLLPTLHQQLVDLAEESPSQCPFDENERAELLWTASVWLERLNTMAIVKPERFEVIHEQIHRYGALAWMQLDHPQALRRSLSLLLQLSTLNPEAISWTKPACVDRLEQELLGLEAMIHAGQPSTELSNHLHDLSWLLQSYQDIFSGDVSHSEPGLSQHLRDLHVTLEVWRQLRLA